LKRRSFSGILKMQKLSSLNGHYVFNVVELTQSAVAFDIACPTAGGDIGRSTFM